MKKVNITLMLALAAVPVLSDAADAPPAIVQWGAPGGQTDIVSTRTDGGWSLGTTYAGGAIASPENVAYYASPADVERTPEFFGAGSVLRKVEVNDKTAGDECWTHARVAADTRYRGMLAWKSDEFLDLSRVSRFEIEIKNRNTTDRGQISWLVEQGGNWYISEVAGEFNTTGYASIAGNTFDMTWYEFTPFVDGVEAVGPAVSITFDEVTSVGYYWNTLNTADSLKWVGSIVRYFSVKTPPRAMYYEGWIPRVQLPTKINATERADFTDFDVSAFVDQLVQLDTATAIYLNLGHGAVATYYTASHPELAAAVNADMFPAERDLLTEVLDELELRGDYRPVIVYFAAFGVREVTCPAGAWDNWNNHIASLGYTDHNEAVADLIIEYYSVKYGDRIDGWWFDGANQLSSENQQRYFNAARQGNPYSLITMPISTGAPLKSSPWCDYTSGHPFSVKANEPWQAANLQMIENIEAGPWLDTEGNPVADPSEGALAHAFLPLQRKWNYGEAFPALQAIDWSTRAVAAGGVISWSLNRQGSVIEAVNFDTLLKINAAMTNPVVLASGENGTHEGVVQAFDGDIATKWLTFESTGWLAYDFTSTDAYVVTQYSITSANDGAKRDPKNWEFQGSNDGGMTWDTLDTQIDQDFAARHQTNTYPISNSTAYKVYRLNITANSGSAQTQLAELTLEL